jgi:hypothetical protein
LLPTCVVKTAPQIKASKAGTMVVNRVLLELGTPRGEVTYEQ